MRATAKGAVLIVAAMVAALAASPALAQTADLPGGGSEPPPKYAFDGETVIIEGDAATTCSSFAAFLDQGYFESGDPSTGARRVLEQCEDAGLLAPGAVTTSGASPSGSVDASTSPGAAAADGEGGGLPDTGGLNLPVLLAALSILAMTGGFLARGITRE